MGNNEKQKKVCIITTVHPPFDIRIFHKQAKTLAKAGYDVSLIATHNKKESIDGVEIIPLPKPKNRFERMFINTFKALKLALKQNAGIYHFHDPELYFIAFLIKIITGEIVIHDIHEHYSKDIMAKHWIPKHYRKAYLFFFNIYEQLFVPYLDVLIYVVPSIKERYNYFNKKMLEIRNYPIIEMFESLTDEKIQKEREYNRVIFSGLICPERGIKEIIKAFSIVISKIPDAKLDLAGNFSTIGSSKEKSYRNEVEEMVKEYKLKKNVIIYGAYKQQELPNLLSKAAIGLVLYLPISENNVIGLPNKIFEYMACKMSVLCSNFPLYEEIVNESKCGFSVDPRLPEKIAEKLIELLSDIDNLKEMGLSGYSKITSMYNWEKESKKLLDLYDQLLSKG